MSTWAKDFIGRDINYECLECSLKNHEIISTGGLIYEDDLIIVHPHLLVKLKGFIVIAPKRHVALMSELTNEEKKSICDAIECVVNTLKINQVADEFKVWFNDRENGHFDVWIVPILHPLLEEKIEFDITSEGAMKYRGITPSETIEILYTVQILKTSFKAKAFTQANHND